MTAEASSRSFLRGVRRRFVRSLQHGDRVRQAGVMSMAASFSRAFSRSLRASSRTIRVCVKSLRRLSFRLGRTAAAAKAWSSCSMALALSTAFSNGGELKKCGGLRFRWRGRNHAGGGFVILARLLLGSGGSATGGLGGECAEEQHQRQQQTCDLLGASCRCIDCEGSRFVPAVPFV